VRQHNADFSQYAQRRVMDGGDVGGRQDV